VNITDTAWIGNLAGIAKKEKAGIYRGIFIVGQQLLKVRKRQGDGSMN